MNRIYLCIDLKSFYASVECVARELDPLTTNLVVADKERTEKTICLAVTPSLKAYGISGRARLFEVVQRVEEINRYRRSKAPGRMLEGESYDDPELKRNPSLALSYIVAPPRMSYYMETSARIYDVYLKFIAPEDIHVYSIDEVFIDLTPYLKTYQKTPREMAQMLIKEVLTTTGITATAGIGTNMYLAKVAMDITAKKMPADENGVRIAELDEMSYRRELWTHRPLTDFWMVGRGISKKLEDNYMFAKQMYIGFTEKQIALCEAEVGTGKTLSYLVAAIVAKHHNSRIYGQKLPVTITTSSIELQKALVEREIPNLSRMLLDYYIIEKPLTAVLRKGKEHYLCRYRFEDYLRNIKQYPVKYASTIELLEQMADFRFGIDLDRYRISGAIKNRICIKGSCAGCSQKKQCKYHDFAKQMYHLPDLDFQVTNHNMYLMSQKTKSDDHPPLLRESCFVVVDEAHKFKEAAEDTFGERISEKDIPRYVNSVKTLCSPKANRDKYKEHLVSLISENETLFNIGKILRQLCEQKGIEIISAEACPDHIHMLLSIPPKYSVAQVMGYLKGKSSLMIFDRHANLKYKYENRHFWARG